MTRRLPWVLLLALGACTPSPVPPTTPPRAAVPAEAPKPVDRLARGKQGLVASRYAQAEADLRAVLGTERDAEARLELSEVLLVTGRYDEATSEARAVRSRGSALAERPGLIAAEALRRQGALAEAEAELLPFESQPAARAARLALAEIRIETGRRQAAESLLHALIDDYNDERIREDDGPALALTARAAWLLRSPKDANTLFNAAERADPGNVRTLLWRAELFLEKYDPGHAEEVLEEILKKAPHHPEALTGLSHVRLDQALDFDEAEALATAALEQNPRLSGAHFVLAGIALRDMELESAEARISDGLKSNPRNLDLLSLEATARFLADDKQGFEKQKERVLGYNPEYSRLYAVVGEYADWQHRYDEIVALMREALRIDAADAGALAQLGLNLIRAGQESDGVSTLSRAFSLDPFNVRVYNTLNLYDELIPKSYVTVSSPRFRIRYHKNDRPILERYVPGLLERAWKTMVRGYGFTPATPVGIEIYAERESFAVRTSGLPRTAIQGVCFGKTLASMSPQNESFNLGMTLWHELSHVFHIQLSRSRVPRWFTEGLAEHETEVTRPEWRREQDPELYEMLRAGKLPSVGQMSRAFTRAERLSDVATAYYASSRVVALLAERYGRKKLAEMLHLWGEGRRDDEVLQTALGLSPTDLDAAFRKQLGVSLQRYQEQFVPLGRARPADQLEEALSKTPADPDLWVERALGLLRKGKVDDADAAARHALELDPKHAQARFFLARLEAQSADKKKAEALLTSMLKDGQKGYALFMLMAELAHARGDAASSRAALESAHLADPSASEPLVNLVELAQKGQDEEEELSQLQKLTLLSEHDADAHRRYLALLVSKQRFPEAVRAGETALWVDLEGADTHRLYAEALAQTGDRAKARFELETALLCPAAPETQANVHRRLAELLRAMGQPAAARRHDQQAAELGAEKLPPPPGP